MIELPRMQLVIRACAALVQNRKKHIAKIDTKDTGLEGELCSMPTGSGGQSKREANITPITFITLLNSTFRHNGFNCFDGGGDLTLVT